MQPEELENKSTKFDAKILSKQMYLNTQINL